MSLARRVLIGVMIIQALGFVREVLFAIGLDRYLEAITTGSDMTLVAATVVLIGVAALIVPVWRGNRWATLATVPLLILLLVAAVPVFAPMFGSPSGGNFAAWLTVTVIIVSALVGIPYAIAATLEGFGRPPATATAERGFSVASLFLVAVTGAMLGMTVLAAAVAARPSVGEAAFDEAPDDFLAVTMRDLAFQPEDVRVAAGQTTALFVTNEDGFDHSLDIDVLDVHVMVPGGQTKIVMVSPEVAEPLEIYCGIPGHTEAGMVARLVAE